MATPPCCPWCCLQTKVEQKVAKGTTQEEFEDCMWYIQAKARKELGKHGLTPLFSYDNNRIQAGASFERMGISLEEKVPLAPYMPDAHRVIEHTFHNLKRMLWDSIYHQGIEATGLALQLRMMEVFKSIPAEWIARDCAKLPLGYEMIATDKNVLFMSPTGHEYAGTGGDWASYLLR